MSNIQDRRIHPEISLRLLTRFYGLVTNSVFLLIICLALTNEDRPQGPAITVLALLGLTMVSSFIAWRWEKVGGALVIAGALGTGVAAYSASLEFGLGSQSFLPGLIYSIPFLVMGILFWLCGYRAPAGSAE
ncbi:MAG: hypothetical protein PVH11_10920 [Anaerolineae bacterium]|jgi:hypothetical protein